MVKQFKKGRKSRSAARFGPRYGRKSRKLVADMEEKSRALYDCPRCGRNRVRQNKHCHLELHQVRLHLCRRLLYTPYFHRAFCSSVCQEEPGDRVDDLQVYQMQENCGSRLRV